MIDVFYVLTVLTLIGKGSSFDRQAYLKLIWVFLSLLHFISTATIFTLVLLFVNERQDYFIITCACLFQPNNLERFDVFILYFVHLIYLLFICHQQYQHGDRANIWRLSDTSDVTSAGSRKFAWQQVCRSPMKNWLKFIQYDFR